MPTNTLQVRIDRTRMAMDGNVYCYDAVVPVSEVDESRYSYFIVRDGVHYVSLVDALRPAELDAMPRGLARWDAFKAHEKAIVAREFELMRSHFPELRDQAPATFFHLPELEASHDSKVVTL